MADQEQQGPEELLSLLGDAMAGEGQAVASLISTALPRLHGHVTDLQAQIKYQRAGEWMDEAEARRLAMNGEIPPQQTVGAMSDLMTALLRVCAYVPIALVAGPREREEWEAELVNACYSLALTLHNPVIKYGLIGGLKPELRPEAEEYLDRMGREVWGTALALTRPGELDAEDFPPEVQAIIVATAEEAEATAADVEADD